MSHWDLVRDSQKYIRRSVYDLESTRNLLEKAISAEFAAGDRNEEFLRYKVDSFKAEAQSAIFAIYELVAANAPKKEVIKYIERILE